MGGATMPACGEKFGASMRAQPRVVLALIETLALYWKPTKSLVKADMEKQGAPL